MQYAVFNSKQECNGMKKLKPVPSYTLMKVVLRWMHQERMGILINQAAVMDKETGMPKEE